MIRTVWKFRAEPLPEIQTAPCVGKPLAIAEDGTESLCAWWEVQDPEAEPTAVEGRSTFCVIGTGWDVPDGFQHVDTVVTRWGYVWHLYWREA